MTFGILASLVFVAFSGLSYWMAADFIQGLFRGGITVPPLPDGAIGPHNFVEFLKHYSALFLSADTPVASLKRAIIIIVAAFLVKNLALYIQVTISASVEQHVAKAMRDELYSKLLKQDLAFFHVRKSGDLVSAGINDITALNAGLADSFSKLIRDPITALLFLVLLLAISWKLTLAALLIAPLSTLIIALAGMSLKRKSQRTQQRLSLVTSRLNDALQGIRIVQAYGGEKKELNTFKTATDGHFRQALGRERLRRSISPLNEVVGVIVVAGILLIAGGKVLGGQWLEPDDFVRFLMLLFGLLSPIVSLSGVQGNLKVAEGASQRVFDLMDADFYIHEKKEAVNADGFRDNIRFENVSLRYAEDREEALQNLDIVIKPGENIVLVGRSGAGKSTVMNLLPRFYDPAGGKITLDGVDLKEYNIEELRKLFGVVTQEIVLFNDTIKANIAYNSVDIPFERIVDAAKLAQAHEFIEKLVDGYETNIGDLGDKLSGGQRQRISIARALLKDPPILLLDEPTSALDSDVAEEILTTLEEAGIGRTVITATHRLSSITNADRILLFDAGKMIDEGTHQSLYDGNELYKELYDKQFVG
ncbi:MAG: ABC transporter ATP-binding protein [Candidatus Electryonea clarkiae]|nr:ABC transporter ATP-binding protein [Candidatus Electryonea clarkiae]